MYSLVLRVLLVTLSPRISMLAFRFSIYFLLCVCRGTACLKCNNDSLSPGACLKTEFTQITQIDVFFFLLGGGCSDTPDSCSKLRLIGRFNIISGICRHLEVCFFFLFNDFKQTTKLGKSLL